MISPAFINFQPSYLHCLNLHERGNGVRDIEFYTQKQFIVGRPAILWGSECEAETNRISPSTIVL